MKKAMIFNEFTLHGGRVQTRQKWDTRALHPEALELCRRLLKEMRQNEFSSLRPIPTIPNFQLMLGLPEWLRVSNEEASDGECTETQGRFFSVWASDPDNPFQVNLLLPAVNDDLPEDVEERLCGTLLALSSVGASETQKWEMRKNVAPRVTSLLEARPVLATTLLPTEDLDLDTMETAAHFSTCFAAALLEDNEFLMKK